MKFRILFKSFNKYLINKIIVDFQLYLKQNNYLFTGFVSLPIKKKRFCVLRSPHIDKDSREHFEIRIYKKFIDIETLNSNIFNNLLNFKIPAGISCSIKVL